MTGAPLGENEGDDDGDETEAVAAFTTPLAMISLILFTASREGGIKRLAVKS